MGQSDDGEKLKHRKGQTEDDKNFEDYRIGKKDGANHEGSADENRKKSFE